MITKPPNLCARVVSKEVRWRARTSPPPHLWALLNNALPEETAGGVWTLNYSNQQQWGAAPAPWWDSVRRGGMDPRLDPRLPGPRRRKDAGSRCAHWSSYQRRPSNKQWLNKIQRLKRIPLMSRFQLRIISHTKNQEDFKVIEEKAINIRQHHDDQNIKIIWQGFESSQSRKKFSKKL